MTIYDMSSVSRRVLRTLASSLPSKDGLPPSLTVKLGTREERLAARLVQRLGLEPPVDVEKIASAYATVVTKRFPEAIDGLCLDLKVGTKRPKVWVSADISRVRRRFTLAHEIGHIVIPWHTGTIVDEIDAGNGNEADRYREMEAEANRFAAELLMPTVWVQRTIERVGHASVLMETLRRVADVSYFAAMLRVVHLAPAGYVGAQVYNGTVVWSGRTTGTEVKPPRKGMRLGNIEELLFDQPKIIRGGDSKYYWWKIRTTLTAPAGPALPWREILDEILLSVPQERRASVRNSVNAVIGNAFGRLPKGTPVDDLYAAALGKTQNRSDRDNHLRIAFNHPQFSSYLLARCYEHANG